MSLINEVLEDLDARHAAPAPARVALVDDVPRSDDGGQPGTDWVRYLAWSAVAAAVVAFAAWEWLQTSTPAGSPEILPVVATPVVEPARAPEPEQPPPVEVVLETPAAVTLRQSVAEASPPIEPQTTPAVTGKEPTVGDVESIEPEVEAPTTIDALLPVPLREPVKRPVREAEPGTLALARERIAAGRLAEAEAELRVLLAQKPAARQGRELLVGLLVRGGRDDEAMAELRAGLERHPDHAPFRLMAAHLYARVKDLEGAIGMLEGARMTDASALLLLATLYQQSGRHEQAIPLYRTLVAKMPGEGRYHAGLGMALESSREIPEAINAYRRALARGGFDAVVRDYLIARLRALAPSS